MEQFSAVASLMDVDFAELTDDDLVVVGPLFLVAYVACCPLVDRRHRFQLRFHGTLAGHDAETGEYLKDADELGRSGGDACGFLCDCNRAVSVRDNVMKTHFILHARRPRSYILYPPLNV